MWFAMRLLAMRALWRQIGTLTAQQTPISTGAVLAQKPF
jgi:hypothetical protein